MTFCKNFIIHEVTKNIIDQGDILSISNPTAVIDHRT